MPPSRSAPAAPAPADFEKLGVFYLGREYELAAKKAGPGLLLYDARDLVTHAVCVGMTGSGKTGLCLSLLEEAALDGVPAIAIDPKGDLANLLLTFPELRPDDFAPWINEEDARRKGVTPAEFAVQQAETWRNGLAAWGQDGDRIRRLRSAADFAVYTPGSPAGRPISILASFAAPPAAVREDAEALRERVLTTATSLLGLAGIDADPLKSREHVLVSTLLDAAWRAGTDLGLEGLIQQIQSPPMSRVGVLDLESFFPARARFELAMAINNILAAPGFGAWMAGEPLDVGRLLRTPEGKPRVAIVSIAHLGDAERMFFVSLLLNEVLGWMRGQSGTTSLRALLYMDEVFGYFPPVANPPSKTPLLTLLKQARAFGLGVVLATQNPVDLDYKGLSNAGTWFIGRLQTERDKARVLEGLEGASAGASKGFDRGAMEETIAGLGNRVFLMHDVHEDAPVVFETRWAMSYLRGPLTRAQIRQLTAGEPAAAAAPTAVAVAPAAAPAIPAAAEPGARATAAPPPAPAGAVASARPVLPPDVPQHFVPVRGTSPAGAVLEYQPMLLGAASVRFVDRKAGVDALREPVVLAPIGAGAVAVSWDDAEEVEIPLADLETVPADGARFAELAAAAARKKSFDVWAKELAGWLYRTQKLELYRSAVDKLSSRPGETEGEFRARLQEATRAVRDAAADKLRQKYAPKIAALQERIRRAEQARARESEQVAQSGLQAAISIGATVVGAFLGRKAMTASTVGRATTAMRGAGRVLKERQDVGRAEETLQALQQQLAALDETFKAEADALAGTRDPLTAPLEALALSPTKQNVAVSLVALAWLPYWRDVQGTRTAAWR